MNFKASREALGLTLKEVSVIAGYSIPTINALELEGRGSERLREKLQYVYSLKKDYTPDSEMALREQPVEYKVRDSRLAASASICAPSRKY